MGEAIRGRGITPDLRQKMNSRQRLTTFMLLHGDISLATLVKEVAFKIVVDEGDTKSNIINKGFRRFVEAEFGNHVPPTPLGYDLVTKSLNPHGRRPHNR